MGDSWKISEKLDLKKTLNAPDLATLVRTAMQMRATTSRVLESHY